MAVCSKPFPEASGSLLKHSSRYWETAPLPKQAQDFVAFPGAMSPTSPKMPETARSLPSTEIKQSGNKRLLTTGVAQREKMFLYDTAGLASERISC